MLTRTSYPMTFISSVPLVFILSINFSASVCAQPGFEPEARVRLWSLDLPEREINGRLVQLTQDSITLSQIDYLGMDPVLALPLVRVGRIDLNIGRNEFAIGASVAAGAALGAVILPVLDDEPVSCELGYIDDPDCSSETADVVIGLAAGAIGGFLFSNLIAKERWLSVRMDVLLLDGSVRFHSRVGVPIPNVF